MPHLHKLDNYVSLINLGILKIENSIRKLERMLLHRIQMKFNALRN